MLTRSRTSATASATARTRRSAVSASAAPGTTTVNSLGGAVRSARQVGLVGGELVGAEQGALADGVQALGVRRPADRGQQADHRAASGQRAAGGAGGAAHGLGAVRAGGVGRAETGDGDDRERALAEGGQPGDLVLGAAGAQVGQGRQQPAAEQPVDRLGARGGQQPVGALADGDDDGVAGQLLERVVGGGDRRRHRSIVGGTRLRVRLRREPADLPLHDRHVAAGAKLADFSGWSMPIEYAGGGVLAEHTAVREGVGPVRRLPPRDGDGARARARRRSSTAA